MLRQDINDASGATVPVMHARQDSNLGEAAPLLSAGITTYSATINPSTAKMQLANDILEVIDLLTHIESDWTKTKYLTASALPRKSFKGVAVRSFVILLMFASLGVAIWTAIKELSNVYVNKYLKERTRGNETASCNSLWSIDAGPEMCKRPLHEFINTNDCHQPICNDLIDLCKDALKEICRYRQAGPEWGMGIATASALLIFIVTLSAVVCIALEFCRTDRDQIKLTDISPIYRDKIQNILNQFGVNDTTVDIILDQLKSKTLSTLIEAAQNDIARLDNVEVVFQSHHTDELSDFDAVKHDHELLKAHHEKVDHGAPKKASLNNLFTSIFPNRAAEDQAVKTDRVEVDKLVFSYTLGRLNSRV